MADSEIPTRKILVANARPEDSGRGLAHLPRALMATLGIGEGDVIEVEIESHADRIGRHQEVNVAILVERDLGVARARAERAELHAPARVPGAPGAGRAALRRPQADRPVARRRGASSDCGAGGAAGGGGRAAGPPAGRLA